MAQVISFNRATLRKLSNATYELILVTLKLKQSGLFSFIFWHSLYVEKFLKNLLGWI